MTDPIVDPAWRQALAALAAIHQQEPTDSNRR
jgi:hypothetical protein